MARLSGGADRGCVRDAAAAGGLAAQRAPSNSGVAAELGVSERTVEATCAALFRKLDLEASPDTNRRVLAVLATLRG